MSSNPFPDLLDTMTSPSTLHSHRPSRPSRTAKHMAGDEQAVKKPKKANSEIRKQQNRIASKNYREKRKRKLQYLQQLIKDESSEQQTSAPSPEQQEAYARALSVGYESSGRSSSPYMLPSNTTFASIGSSCATVSDPVLIANGAPVGSHQLATSQPYSHFVTDWSAPVYSSPPSVSVPTFDIPFSMPNMEFVPRAPSHPESLHYTTPSGPPVFAQANASLPPQQQSQPYDYMPEADYYAWGSALRSQNQTPSFPNVSAPTSSPYYQPYFAPPH